jgi:hypothetical protein
MGGFQALLASIVAPGFVAAVVAFILNTRDERRRTLRDYKTKFLEDTREDVRRAVTAGVAYFSCKDPKKLRELEAQVLLYESDVRSGLAAIRLDCEGQDQAIVLNLSEAEQSFLTALTGGSFGSAGPSPSLSNSQVLVGRGSILRGELAKLRRHQLSRARFGNHISKVAGWMILLLAVVGVTFGAGIFAGVLIVPH